MQPGLILAIVLIVGGSLGLVYGGFTYTKDSHEAKLDPIELSVKDRETVNIPDAWAGVGAIVNGGMLLLVGSRKTLQCCGRPVVRKCPDHVWSCVRR